MKTELLDLEGMKVLVVEDDPTSLYMLNIIFRKMNAKMHQATDGIKALKLLEKHAFDLIMMDVNMPIMDGMTASRLIRQANILNRNKEPIGIIAMTAYAMSGDKEKCIQAGMNDYVSKPIEFDELIGILSKYKHNVLYQPCSYASALLDLKSSFGLDDESCAVILETYTNQSLEIIASIREILGQGDLAAISSLLHRLKGSSGNARVFKVMDKAIEGEAAILKGDIEKTINLLQEIEAIIKTLKCTQANTLEGDSLKE